jgi:hypothetical protein
VTSSSKNKFGQNINELLKSDENRIRSMATHPSNPIWISAGPEVTTLSPKVVRAGSGRTRVNPDGTPYVQPEFPEGGDPRFRAILAEMLRVHISKSSDYGTGKDIYANYRASEAIGVPAWKSCFIRALEKVQRLTNAASGKRLNHESVTDSFLDLANHIVISKVLYDESQAKSCGNPDCGC